MRDNALVTSEDLPPDLRTLRRTTDVLDRAIRVPGTDISFGLDALIGLVPGAGDVVAALLGSSVILSALRHRVPVRVIARMVLNVLADMGLGAIPVVGDVVDVFFKSNSKNLDLLLLHRDAALPPREIPAVLGGIVVAVGVVIGGTGVLLTWAVLSLFLALLQLIGG